MIGLLLLLLCLAAISRETTALDHHRSRLREIFERYPDTAESRGFDRWLQYAGNYEENTKHLLHQGYVKMLEIGVQNGGSIGVWQEYFNSSALLYVGVDVLPACKSFENPNENVFIEIGSQGDPNFMKQVCDSYGPFDFIVDDGGHFTGLMMTSFYALWPSCMRDNGVYAIEDTHSMAIFPEAQQLYQGMDLFGHMAALMRKQSSYLTMQYNEDTQTYDSVALEPDHIVKHIQSWRVYDSIVFLHFQEDFESLERIQRGGRKDAHPLRGKA